MMIEPTPQEEAQCAIAQQEFVELINRMLNEGFDRRTVTAGLAAASAATIKSIYGAAEVPRWFAKQTAMTYHFSEEG